MRLFRTLALAVFVLGGACTPPPPANSPVLSGCRLSDRSELGVPDWVHWATPGEIRVLPRPVAFTRFTGGQAVAISQRCRAQWSVQGGSARIDELGRLVVLETARPGDSVRVVVHAMGNSTARTLRIVHPVTPMIVGTWSQRDTDHCVGAKGLVREFKVERTGEAMITFTPFESYVDLAGRYTFDHATGEFEIRGRDRSGEEYLILRGRAERRDGRLLLHVPPDGDPLFVFSAMNYTRGCTAVF